MDRKEASVINYLKVPQAFCCDLWTVLTGPTICLFVYMRTYFTARPLQERTLSGLCPTNREPLHGSRCSARTEKAKGKSICSKLEEKTQNKTAKFAFEIYLWPESSKYA